MKLIDPNNPGERKKAIWAAVLGVVAISLLGYLFFSGSSSSPPKPTNTNNRAVATASPRPGGKPPADELIEDPAGYTPISINWTVASAPEPNRNIFTFYEPPPPTPRPPAPPSTPTPTPPVILSSLSPPMVYARTGDFTLQATGDKFTPVMHITIDGGDLPTRFINEKELATTVPSALIANAGMRQVMVRSADMKLYSNMATLNVTPPPDPNSNYTYVGIIGKPHFNDTAVLQDKNSKELLNVHRGDLLGNRFRVTSISEREVALVDTILKIKHTITFSNESNPSGAPYRPPVRSADEEP
jgi:hypothetical protein